MIFSSFRSNRGRRAISIVSFDISRSICKFCFFFSGKLISMPTRALISRFPQSPGDKNVRCFIEFYIGGVTCSEYVTASSSLALTSTRFLAVSVRARFLSSASLLLSTAIIRQRLDERHFEVRARENMRAKLRFERARDAQ